MLYLPPTDSNDLFCNIELLRNWSLTFHEGLEEHLGPKLDGEFGVIFEEMVRRRRDRAGPLFFFFFF